jgi:hypothetical protein
MAQFDIYSAALLLPEAQRLELASRLIASVDGPGDPEWEDEWMDEIDGRARQATGADAPWPQVRERLQARLPRR